MSVTYLTDTKYHKLKPEQDIKYPYSLCRYGIHQIKYSGLSEYRKPWPGQLIDIIHIIIGQLKTV